MLVPRDASGQAGITPVTGFHGSADPFENQNALKVSSAEAPIAGISGAHATVEVECDEPSDLLAAASSLFGMSLGPSLGFKVGITGASLDIVTSSSVHTTPNLFGSPSRYSTEDRTVDLKLRFDAEEKIEDAPKATDTHHIEFSYYAPEHADESQKLLIGFSANGRSVVLALNLREKALKNVISQCHALKVEQARARDEAQRERILKEAATHWGHPEGFPCMAVAKQDLVLKGWDQHAKLVDLDDRAARIRAGANLHALLTPKNSYPNDQTVVVALRSDDDQNLPRYVGGFAPTSALELKCDPAMVAAEAKADAEKKQADLAAREKPVTAMIAYLGLGPVPGDARSDSAIYVKTKAAVRGYSYDGGYYSGVNPKYGKPSGTIDPAIELTVVESAFKDAGAVGAQTTCSLVGPPYVGSAKILFGKKYVHANCHGFPQGIFLPVDDLDYSTHAAWNDWKPGNPSQSGAAAPANIPAVSAQPPAAGRTADTVQAEGTWIDPQTRLMWTSKDNESDVDWPHAQQYCQTLRTGGLDGWRLPSLAELKGLYDKNLSETPPPFHGFVMRFGGRGNVSPGTTWTVHLRGNIHLDAPIVWSNGRGSFSNIQTANDFSFEDGKDRDTSPSTSALMRCLCVRGPA